MFDQLKAGFNIVRFAGNVIANHFLNGNRSPNRENGNSLSNAGVGSNTPKENRAKQRAQAEQSCNKRREEKIKPLHDHVATHGPIGPGASPQDTQKVRKVMSVLNRNVAPTGAWNADLTNAVKKFQTDHNEQRKKDKKPPILVDGKVGKETIDAMSETINKKDKEWLDLNDKWHKEDDERKLASPATTPKAENHPVQNAFNGVANFQDWLAPGAGLVTRFVGNVVQRGVDSNKAAHDAIDNTPLGLVRDLMGPIVGIDRTISNNLASTGQTPNTPSVPKSKTDQMNESLTRLKGQVESLGGKFEIDHKAGKVKITVDSKVQFEQNNDALSTKAEIAVESVGIAINRLNDLMPKNKVGVTVSGHASTEGSPEHNMNLSRRRADNVTKYLGSFTGNKNEIKSEAHGEEKPLTGMDGTDPRNRRVEIELDFSSFIEEEKKKEEQKPQGRGSLFAVYYQAPQNGTLLTTKQ